MESKDSLAEVKKGIAPNNENKTTLFDSHSYCCRPGTLPTLCWKEDGRVLEKCITEDRGRLMFLQLQTEQENYRRLWSSHWDGRFLTAQPRHHLESRGRPHPGGMRFYLGDFQPVVVIRWQEWRPRPREQKGEAIGRAHPHIRCRASKSLRGKAELCFCSLES